MEDNNTSFAKLGVVKQLCEACARANFKTPTPIQIKAIPLALAGHDVIGIAKTGSGKTLAYAIPMLQSLLSDSKHMFGVVIAPTRELATQVRDHIKALGASIGVKVVALCGGQDLKQERAELKRVKPHIVVASPGRLLDHVKSTPKFTLEYVKYLVFDEADKILGVDLETHMDDILRVLPDDRRTMLFSATMNKSTNKLKMGLSNPKYIRVNDATELNLELKQYVYTHPGKKRKMGSLVWFLLNLGAKTNLDTTFIVFCNTIEAVITVHIILKNFGLMSVPIFGKMGQPKRMGALRKFKKKERNILIATDVASRGLDITNVTWVVNFDLPISTTDYIHRVGRTARAGRDGNCLSLVASKSDLTGFYGLEEKLKVQMEDYEKMKSEEVDKILPSVLKALENAAQEAEEFMEHLAQESSMKKRRLEEIGRARDTWKKAKR